MTCLPYCGTVSGLPPAPQAMQVSVNADALKFSGELAFQGDWYKAELPVTGSLSETGSLVLSGRQDWDFWCFGVRTSSPPMKGVFVLESWSSIVEPSSGKMLTKFSYTLTKHINSCVYGNIKVEASAVLSRR